MVGANAVIGNTGSIRTSGRFGIAQQILGDNGRVSNSGSITTTNENSSAQRIAGGDGGAINNSGSIVAVGRASSGQAMFGDNHSANNSGSIVATGPFGYGQFVQGNNGAITNSGRLISAQTRAIYLIGSGHTLNLRSPAFIGGIIDIETGAADPTVVNIKTGQSHSVLWTFRGDLADDAPNVSGSVPGFYNRTTQQFATYDRTGFAGLADQAGGVARTLSSMGFSQLNGAGAGAGGLALGFAADGEPVQDDRFALFEAVSTSGHEHARHGIWVTSFGSVYDVNGREDDGTLDREIRQGGIAAGYRHHLSDDMVIGVMAGYLTSSFDAESRWADSIDIDTEGFFVGLNGQARFGAFELAAGVTAGRLSHDQDRFVNNNLAQLGEDSAQASYDSWFFAPELFGSYDVVSGDNWRIHPGAGLRYVHQSIDGYDEDGAGAANAEVGSMTIGMLEARAELAVTYEGGLGSITTRAGVLGSFEAGNNEARVTLIDVTRTVDAGDGDQTAGYIGLDASLDITDAIVASAGANLIANDDVLGFSGNATLSVRF